MRTQQGYGHGRNYIIGDVVARYKMSKVSTCSRRTTGENGTPSVCRPKTPQQAQIPSQGEHIGTIFADHEKTDCVPWGIGYVSGTASLPPANRLLQMDSVAVSGVV